MHDLHDRIRARLAETGKSMRRASLDSGLSGEAISKLLRSPLHSQTLETVEKLAVGLETTALWLAYGRTDADVSRDPSLFCVDRSLLRQAIEFVLKAEGVSDERAAIVADILPEALQGSPVDAVERDPLLSFRVHFQLGSEHPKHQ